MPTAIDRKEVQRLLDEGAVVVEVLERSQYDTAHLPGAIHIPAWELTEERVAGFDRQHPLIVYCFDTQ